MKIIADALSQIGAVLQRGERIVYIDYPVHANVGDLLIQEGDECFFERQGIAPKRRYSVHLFLRRKLPTFPKGHTIVFHGGGNFGDLHRPFQQLRERIIAGNPSHRIVILPQTIHFSSEDALARSSRIHRGHDNLHIFCRDRRSHELALKHFSRNSYLAPDMAHFLHPISRTAPCENKELFLLRRDMEASATQDRHGTAHGSVDWDAFIRKRDYFLIRSCAALHRIAAYCHVPPSFYRSWRRVQLRVVRHVVTEFSRYSYVTSSRLHAHILSTLMGIPNTLIDNSYGKNSAYFEAWTSGFPFSSLSVASAD